MSEGLGAGCPSTPEADHVTSPLCPARWLRGRVLGRAQGSSAHGGAVAPRTPRGSRRPVPGRELGDGFPPQLGAGSRVCPQVPPAHQEGAAPWPCFSAWWLQALALRLSFAWIFCLDYVSRDVSGASESPGPAQFAVLGPPLLETRADFPRWPVLRTPAHYSQMAAASATVPTAC